jgi:hypothetical protein
MWGFKDHTSPSSANVDERMPLLFPFGPTDVDIKYFKEDIIGDHVD